MYLNFIYVKPFARCVFTVETIRSFISRIFHEIVPCAAVFIDNRWNSEKSAIERLVIEIFPLTGSLVETISA